LRKEKKEKIFSSRKRKKKRERKESFSLEKEKRKKILGTLRKSADMV
jgi:hypothetical protein